MGITDRMTEDRKQDMIRNLKFWGSTAVFASVLPAVVAASLHWEPPAKDLDQTAFGGGALYASHMVVGAADGLSEIEELGATTQDRVETLRTRLDGLGAYNSNSINDQLHEIQEDGYSQAVAGGWSEAALNGYMDAIEQTDKDLMEDVRQAEANGIFSETASPSEGASQSWHKISASKMIYDITEASYLVVQVGQDDVPRGDMFREIGVAVDAYFSLEPTGPQPDLFRGGDKVMADYAELPAGVAPEFITADAEQAVVDPFAEAMPMQELEQTGGPEVIERATMKVAPEDVGAPDDPFATPSLEADPSDEDKHDL